MEWIKGDKSEKILFVVVNLALAAGCIRFLVHLIARWNGMVTDTRYHLGVFMVFFCFLWVTLIRSGKSVFSLLMALIVLMAVYEIAGTIM